MTRGRVHPSFEQQPPARLRYRARWVVPIVGPPLEDAFVDVQGGRVVAVTARGGLAGAAVPLETPSAVYDLGEAAVLPAFVNAHTHLELSALRDHVPPVAVMADWVRALMRERQRVTPEVAARAVEHAIHELHAWGVAAIGEVTNSLSTIDALSRSTLGWRAFHELLGFRVTDGAAMIQREVARWPSVPESATRSLEIAAHAPYSTSPALIAAVASWVSSRPDRRTTIHLGESAEEVAFLRDGTGPWRELLESLGAWAPDWKIPTTDPVSYVSELGLLGPRTLVVHGVQFGCDAIARLKSAGATIVLCPRSNRWTGAGDPPLRALHESGVAVAMGTDSLASVDDLGLFGEMAAARAMASDVPASWLLRAATLGGAQGLGFTHLGAIEPGRSAALLSVDVPASERDVEQYLVSGVDRAAVRWIGE